MEKVTERKVWETPSLVVYGDMNVLTQIPKVKVPGPSDDFQTNDSDFP